MADLLVMKIECNGTLRRFTLPKSPEPSFTSLDKKIRELYGFPQQASLTVSYTDSDGDIVTMAGDDDLRDAVTFQRLNPLRLSVKVVKGASSQQADAKPAQENSIPKAAPEGSAKNPKIEVDAEKIQEVLQEKLKAAFADAENVTNAFLSGAPRAIHEVVGAALKSGLAAAREANFSVPEKKAAAGTSDPKSTQGAVPEATKQTDGGKKGETSSLKEGSKMKDGDTVPERVFHSGVVCDMCHMSPIVGPRYRSTIKDDYDLCGECYEKYGVAGEYNKMERPFVPFRQFPFAPNPARAGMNVHPFGLGPNVLFGGRPFHAGRGGHCGRSDNWSPDGKLDSRFVKDVTIFDGTEFAPGSRFTKIWRLRNDGSVTWPCNTRLVHVGGDRLGADDSVAVPVPEAQPGEEVEASVDLIAPGRPGRYVGHWRLVTPGGRKFGHRVWVLIQVVPSDEQSPQIAKSVEDAGNKSEPPSACSHTAPPEDKKAEEIVTNASPSTVSVGLVTPAVSEVLRVDVKEQQDVASDNSASILTNPTVPESSQEVARENPEEATSVGGFSLVDHPPTESSPSKVDETNVTVTVPVLEQAPAQNVVSDESHANEEENIVFVNRNNAGVEKNEPVDVEPEENKNGMVMQQLKAMGFSDRQLNEELLKKYDMDFVRVLEELIGGAKWDPILEELTEMGFNNADLNRRLMFKYDGSVKQVIKELVQLYKQQNE